MTNDDPISTCPFDHESCRAPDCDCWCHTEPEPTEQRWRHPIARYPAKWRRQVKR